MGSQDTVPQTQLATPAGHSSKEVVRFLASLNIEQVLITAGADEHKPQHSTPPVP